MDANEAKKIGSGVARKVIELKTPCLQKATGFEVALEELASLEKDLILETMGKVRPDREKVKTMLRGAIETLNSDDVKPADVSGFVDSLQNLIDGIDKKDLPVKGDLLVRHFEDIKGYMWERAWADIVNCECDDQGISQGVPLLDRPVPQTYADWVKLGEDIKSWYAEVHDQGGIATVDYNLNTISHEGSVPPIETNEAIANAKRWLLLAAGRLR